MRKARVSLRLTLAAIVVVYLQAGPLDAQGRPLTLQAAVQAARQNNRLVRAARLRIGEARGDLTGASVRLVDNPELASTAGPRFPGARSGDTTPAVELGVEQRLETGGQRGYRVARALAGVEAVTARAVDVQRVVELAVASTFFETLAAERRLELLEQNERLARELHEVAVRRLGAGEGTPLELNTARIRLAEVQRRALRARVAFEVSTVRLAELLGLPPDTSLQLQGGLPGDEEPPEPDLLVARALQARPDLTAIASQIEAAGASISLADADGRPDVAVGVFYGRDEGDDIVTAGLRVPIPLFNRNQGERERARAEAERLTAQQTLARLSIESEVHQTLLVYEQTRRAVRLYDAEVLRAQEESADLLQRAFEAGEVGIPDVIVVQRELLDGREGYLDARFERALARARLLAATHASQSGPLPGGTP